MFDRRYFLQRVGTGFGMLGLADLLAERGESANPLLSKTSHYRPKARAVIHLFMNGGPSHLDTFDPKPALTKIAGEKLPYELRTERPTGTAFASPYSFAKHGESGLEISEIFPQVATVADELCVIRSMKAQVPNHEPSLMLMNCGDGTQVRPSLGSWVLYGLGTENQNLPGYVAICPNGYPIKEQQNWQSAFLPGVLQGTYINPVNKSPKLVIENLQHAQLSMSTQRQQLDLVQQLNRRHLEQRGQDELLEARIQSLELAYRMQIEATDAFDITNEPKHIHALYDTKKEHGRMLLTARRLVERGVRFIQLWHGQGQPWDSHDRIEKEHRKLADQCDQPIAGLIKDLKQRGMLDEVLIMWGGEFGRTPTVELPKAGANQGTMTGRDHNHYGFTYWLAGGGVKGGMTFGATDEFGFKAVENIVTPHDLHATILHLLGLDHEKLTYRYAGRDFRLTDVYGNVIKEICQS